MAAKRAAGNQKGTTINQASFDALIMNHHSTGPGSLGLSRARLFVHQRSALRTLPSALPDGRASDMPTMTHGVATASIGLGLRGLLARRMAVLSDAERWRRETARVQVQQLRWLLKRAAGTEFGRARGFARIAALPDAELLTAYRKAIPAGDYEAYRGLIARMREGGERDVLWPGLIRHYAQTSGTTAGDKYIPVSRAMLASNRRAALDIFANAARFGVPLHRLLRGKILFLGGSDEPES